METCISCPIFGELDALAQTYADQAFNALAPRISQLFNAFIGLWFAYELVFKLMLRGEFALQRFLSQVMVFVACSVALENADIFMTYVYQPLRTAMGGLTQMLVAVPATGIADTSYEGLLRTVENELWSVLKLAFYLISEGGLMNTLALFGGLVMAIPFAFVWAIFLAYLLEGTFKLLAVSALAPVLIAAAAFRPTRAFTVMGLRIGLSGVLTVVFAGVAMGFTLSVLNAAVQSAPISSGDIGDDVDTYIRSFDFISLFLIGVISILFHLKASTLASILSGATDGPGAAATVAGVGMAGVAAIKSAGTSVAVAGARMAANAGRSGFGGRLQSSMSGAEEYKEQLLRRMTR